MTVFIRAARMPDARDVARLTSQLGYELAESTAADRLSRILLREDQQFFVAEADGRPVGWLHALVSEFVEAGVFVVIGGLVVDRDYRRQGIGKLLMQEAEAWAVQQGCSIVRLWSTASRTAAHRFYEGLGYRNIKTQYAFVKSLDPCGQDMSRFVPRVEA